MKWHFQPPSGENEAAGDDDSPPGLLGLPAALLERHGARVLDPAYAVAVAGYPRPRPTVYRATTLLVPGDLLRNADFIGAVNEVLRLVGIELVPPEEDADADLDTSGADQEVLAALARLPRPALLVPRPDYRRPVEVDAWTALQTLRAAAPRDQARDEAAADPEEVRLDPELVDRIELEHLLTGSTVMTGSPSGSPGGGGIGGGSGNGSNGSVPGINDSYLFNGDPRTPVAVLLDRPPRLPHDDCVNRYGRRPVVAVLDTGVRAHPWLDVTSNGAGGYGTVPGGFVATDKRIQREISRQSQWAASQGSGPGQVIRDAWDKPVSDNPLIGELNDATGHSTFIAGILRQLVPDATVLAIRVMASDNVLYSGDAICALRHLAKRIAIAKPDDLAAQVDVISMSFGYYSESQQDQMTTSGLWDAITALISLGVVVIASAGNFASRRKLYPAAFALKPVPAGVPVISVGALNVNGTKAMFSNDGDWVTAWAPGAHVVSTYPVDIDASRAPEIRIPVNRKPASDWPPGREALDPDDFSAGFAIWSGTSFAAPYAAALVARSLMAGAELAGGGLRLDRPGTAEKLRRAEAAYDHLPRRIE